MVTNDIMSNRESLLKLAAPLVGAATPGLDMHAGVPANGQVSMRTSFTPRES